MSFSRTPMPITMAAPALLQDSIPGVHLIYGAEDWDAVDQRTGSKPKHDMVGTDGMKVSVGDASVQIVTMPGHTPGTLSYLFEVRDNGKPLRVAYVGGTAIPFNASAAYYDGYLASSQKMAKAAADYGATALMSNHSEFDDAYFKAQTAANRKPGEAESVRCGHGWRRPLFRGGPGLYHSHEDSSDRKIKGR